MGARHGQAGTLPARTPVLRQIAEVVLGVYDQELSGGRWHIYEGARKQQCVAGASGQCFSVVLQEPRLSPRRDPAASAGAVKYGATSLSRPGRKERGEATSEHDAEPTMGGFTYSLGGLDRFIRQ
jgi:hypothetical protein